MGVLYVFFCYFIKCNPESSFLGYFWRKGFIYFVEINTVMLTRPSYPISITMKINPEIFLKFCCISKSHILFFFFFSWRVYVVILSILSLVLCLVKSNFTFRWQWENSSCLCLKKKKKEPAIVSLYLHSLYLHIY